MRGTILLLIIVKLCVDAQIILTPCVVDTVDGKDERVADIRRGQKSQFSCTGFAAGDGVQWIYVPDGGGKTDESAGLCFPLTSPEGCSLGTVGSSLSPSRPLNSESVMTVDPRVAGAEDRVKTGSLGCRRWQDASVTNFCLMDLIDVLFFTITMLELTGLGLCGTSLILVLNPAGGTCSVKFERQNDDGWVAAGSCNITSAYSSRGRYKCHWYRASDSSSEVLQSTVPYTGPSGVCNFIQLLPPDGRYSYRVRIAPGEVSKEASFGSNTNQISTPTAPTVSGCSSDSYIEENSAVNCTCSTTDKPEGVSLTLNSGSLKEVTVRENATVTLTCEANSRPAAMMTVHKDGVTFPVSSGQSPLILTFDPASRADAGTYVCSGSNQFGQPDSPVSGKVYVTWATQGSEGSADVDYRTVTVALAVILAVVVIALVVMTALVVWLCRRRKQANTGTTGPGDTRKIVSRVSLQQEMREVEAAAGPYNMGFHDNTVGPYECLDMLDVDVMSQYSDIGSHDNTTGPHDSPHLPDVGVSSE